MYNIASPSAIEECQEKQTHSSRKKDKDIDVSKDKDKYKDKDKSQDKPDDKIRLERGNQSAQDSGLVPRQ